MESRNVALEAPGVESITLQGVLVRIPWVSEGGAESQNLALEAAGAESKRMYENTHTHTEMCKNGRGQKTSCVSDES